MKLGKNWCFSYSVGISPKYTASREPEIEKPQASVISFLQTQATPKTKKKKNEKRTPQPTTSAAEVESQASPRESVLAKLKKQLSSNPGASPFKGNIMQSATTPKRATRR